jgi:uncharacterized membrane protein
MDLIDKPPPKQPEQLTSANEPPSVQKQEDKKPAEDRLVMLCDGVFAISITLLVINIKIPDGLNETKFNAALNTELFSVILFYVITFAVIAGYWLLHRRIMNIIERLDNRFIRLNLVFLAFIAFFPVSSSILGQGYTYPGAVILYTLTMAGCGFSALALWLYASWHHQLINQAMTREKIISFSIRSAQVPVYFCLSLLLLFTSIQPANIFWTWPLLPLLSFIVQRVSHGRLLRWLVNLGTKPLPE